MDRTKQKVIAGQSYVPSSWPAWFYGPDGQSQVFRSEEEVPEGWEDHPSKVSKGASKSSTGGSSDAGSSLPDDNETVKLLVDSYTADQLVEILEDGQKEDDEVEFLKSWPKLKLAKAIVAYELTPEGLGEEDEEEEEED